MPFQYSTQTMGATNEELGLQIRWDPHFRDGGFARLELVDLRGGGPWYFRVQFETAERTYISKDGPKSYKPDVVCLIYRKSVEDVARKVAYARSLRGQNISIDILTKEIFEGTSEFAIRGGLIFKTIPDYKVSWQD